jgi:hypothetical protein
MFGHLVVRNTAPCARKKKANNGSENIGPTMRIEKKEAMAAATISQTSVILFLMRSNVLIPRPSRTAKDQRRL